LVATACGRGDPPPTSAPEPTTAPSATPALTVAVPTEALYIDEKVEVAVGDRTVTAEVADDPIEIRTGLMFRDSLADDAGMLFLLPAAQTRGFWMKNTRIPLSIAYMNRVDEFTFEVVSMRDMEPCRTDTCPGYPPEPAGTSYNATLEVNQGFLATAGVEVGDELTIRE
jgi:uncharacterized membrane protein (UPF0127 family)